MRGILLVLQFVGPTGAGPQTYSISSRLYLLLKLDIVKIVSIWHTLFITFSESPILYREQRLLSHQDCAIPKIKNDKHAFRRWNQTFMSIIYGVKSEYGGLLKDIENELDKGASAEDVEKQLVIT